MTINLMIDSFPKSLDPRFVLSKNAIDISRLIYSPLFLIDNNLELKPFLAKKIEKIDNLNFNVYLRDDIFFHNEKSITSEDVVYTFNVFFCRKLSYAKNCNYLKCTIINNKVLMFTVNKEFSSFFIDLASVGIISQKNCKDKVERYKYQYVGSGPYKLSVIDTVQEKIKLVSFFKWFEGEPKINCIKIQTVKKNKWNVYNYKEKINFISNIVLFSKNFLDKNKNKIRIVIFPSLFYTYLTVDMVFFKKNNCTLKKLKSKKVLSICIVRKAVLHALNFNKIIELKKNKMLKGVIQTIEMNCYTRMSVLKYIEYSPDKSRQLLDYAKFQDRGKKNGGRFRSDFIVSSDILYQSIVLLVADYLEKIGINILIKVQNQIINKNIKNIFIVNKFDFKIFNNDNALTRVILKNNKSFNFNDLIVLFNYVKSVKKKVDIYNKVQKIILDNFLYIPLCFENNIVYIKKYIIGYEPLRLFPLLGLRKAIFKSN